MLSMLSAVSPEKNRAPLPWVAALLAAAAAFALRQLLYGVQPLDPIAWGLALTAMLLAAGLANFVPARRAMRVDPMAALRAD